MKAAIISIIALAGSALAAPFVENNDIIARADNAELVKRADINNAQDLIDTLQDALDAVEADRDDIENILDQVQNGDITKDEASKEVLPELNDLLDILTNLVTSLTGAAGINLSDADEKTVQNLLVTIATQVTTIVKELVPIIGLKAQLRTIVRSVFQALAEVLTFGIRLVGAVVPGLVAALSPLVVGLSNALVAPLLTLIAGLLAGLAS
ncbi:hypothetical protein BGZ63DRAFT_434111 [Mariannaea sp. PMI_226]|nr:hypothetical protein BGZ63DRAFT_434111 [Mariannaea sp. PMI_226]